MKRPDPIPAPPFAYVPGQGPRHGEDTFAALCATARPGMAPAELAASRAWTAGWQFLNTGYFWEAHEVWEPVWLALPETAPERGFVRAAIQTANAALKARMGRPHAVARLCAMVRVLLADCPGPRILGREVAELERVIDGLAQEGFAKKCAK